MTGFSHDNQDCILVF